VFVFPVSEPELFSGKIAKLPLILGRHCIFGVFLL
jgi:hypothetical protein